MIASKKHTVILLCIIAAVAVIGYMSNARGAAAQPNRIALYVSLLIGQLLWLRYAIMGLRVPLRDVTGTLRWYDVLIAAGLYFAIRYASSLIPHGTERVVNILPRTATEIVLWIALAIAAGVSEEFVFRGYLQRQIGLLPQAIIFGLGHGYQGLAATLRIALFGLMFGLVARYRKGLAPGVIAHAAIDIVSGLGG